MSEHVAIAKGSSEALVSSSPFRAWDRCVLFSNSGDRVVVFATVHLGEYADTPAVCADLWLVHDRNAGWCNGGWYPCDNTPTFSLSRCLDAVRSFDLGVGPQPSASPAGPRIALRVQRTATLCPSRSVDFSHGCFAKWQAECGLRAEGTLRLDGARAAVPFVGYGSRALMRGKWDLDQAHGWIALLASAASPSHQRRQGQWGLSFLLAQPSGLPSAHECVLTLWRDGRLAATFSRSHLRVYAADTIDQHELEVVPFSLAPFQPPAVAPVPRELLIEGINGGNSVRVEFRALRGACILLPSESGGPPGISHQVFGDVAVAFRAQGTTERFRAETVTEFGNSTHPGGAA